MFRAHERRVLILAVVAVLLLVAAVMVAAGCGSSTTTTTTAASSVTTSANSTTTTAASTSTTVAGKARHIILASAYYEVAARQECWGELKQAAAALGWTIDIQDSKADFDKLNSIWADAVSAKPDAIINGGVYSSQVSAGLQDAKAAGIPVFTYDADVSPLAIVNLQSDNTVLGTTNAEYLAKAINYTGNVVIYTQDGAPSVRDRGQAAMAVFAKYPNIHILKVVQPQPVGTVNEVKTNMTDLLTAYPQAGSIAGVFCSWGDPAYGADLACQAAGRDEIKVVGIDATSGEMEQMVLPKPNQIESLQQDWQTLNAKLLQIMVDYFNGKQPDQTNYNIPAITIDTKPAAQTRLDFLKANNY